VRNETKNAAKLNFKQTFFCLKELYEKRYGLYGGKAGLCIGAFLEYRNSAEAIWNQEAMQLLDEICENITVVQQMDFASGLPGIGWALEWIVQNNFVKANTDDVLESLDDELFKAIIYSKIKNLSLETGAIGLALFFYKRLMAQNLYTSRYRKVYIIECLVLLIDEIYNGLLDEKDGLLNNAKPQDMQVIAQSLVFASLVEPLRINHEKVKIVIKEVFKFINVICKTPVVITGNINDPMWQAYVSAGYILKRQPYTFCHTEIPSFSNNNTAFEKDVADAKNGIYELLTRANNNNYGNWREAWLYFL
jgi:hypothetical protein